MRIAIYAFNGVTMFHLAAPQLVFGEVTRLGLAEGWSTVLWSTDTDTVTTAEGNLLGNLAGPEAAEGADLVVIPSWPYPPVTVDDPLRTVLLRAHERGAGVVGLCMGAFAVADAGLMDGRPAVTHWQGMQELAIRHPELAVDDSVLYIDHDDVMTSAGTASSLDACLHLVRKHLGAAAANRVARSLVVAPHREGGQAQCIERPVARPDHGDRLAATLDWAMTRLHEPLSIDELASHARMSRRTFVRRFRDTTGTAPRPLGPRAPPRRGPEPARDHGLGCRPDRAGLRLRQRGHTPAELHRHLCDHALGLPAELRPQRARPPGRSAHGA